MNIEILNFELRSLKFECEIKYLPSEGLKGLSNDVPKTQTKLINTQ